MTTSSETPTKDYNSIERVDSSLKSNNNDDDKVPFTSKDVEVCGRSDEVKKILKNQYYSRLHEDNTGFRRMFLIGSFLLSIVIGCAFIFITNLDDDYDISSNSSKTMSGSSGVHIRHYDPMKKLEQTKQRLCTYEECHTSTCDTKQAPYVCVTSFGACSPYPWITGTCDDQCDLSDCKHVKAPDCSNVQCDDDTCTMACPISAPYQCTDGTAIATCSKDKFMWTSKTNEIICSKCCDTSTCRTTTSKTTKHHATTTTSSDVASKTATSKLHNNNNNMNDVSSATKDNN